MFKLCLAAVSLILAAGPTRIALMIPASADSIAPRNELSSQGCTTMVDTVGTPFSATMRRPYFDPCGVPLAAAGMTLIGALRITAPGSMTPLPSDRKGRYSLPAQRVRRPASGDLPP